MNKRIKLTLGIGLTALLLAAVFATAAFAQGPMGQGGFSGMTLAPALRSGASAGLGSYNGGTGGYGGMMGGYGGMTGGLGGLMNGFRSMMPGWLTGQTTNVITGTVPFGPGMMGGNTVCPGAAGTWGNTSSGEPISFDAAVEAVQEYIKTYDNPALAIAEVMEFENNFYAIIREDSTGTDAFELLVNRYNGAVSPEPGPNMMWNTTYGHMRNAGGMMGGAWNQQTGPLSVTVAEARTAAQQWLDNNLPGATLPDDEMQFPGYYTMDFLKDGTVAGMLSLNGYTGQVWYHTWHGEFISEREF